MRRLGWMVLAVCLVPSTALALAQSLHKSITKDACGSAGLPSSFCNRVAAGAYNVDAYEFDDMAAHAQRANDQTVCQGADAVQARVQNLGNEIRSLVGQMAAYPSTTTAQSIADALGRVLHTIQDNCVHDGVGNPQHAFYSLSDQCEDTELSPDLSAAGQSLAKDETARVFDSFNLLLGLTGLEAKKLDGVKSVSTHWPTRGSVCAYLDSAYDWDGTDIRWNEMKMIPQVEDQLAYSLTTDDESLGSACDPDPGALDPEEVNPPVDVVASMPDWCFTVSIYCLGKADSADEPPPYEPKEAPSSGGCSTTGGMGGLLLAMLLLGLAARRRMG